MAFRAEKNGIDLPGYIELFETGQYSRSFLEPAYVIYSKFLSLISKSSFFFIVVTSLTTMLPLIYVINKESVNKLYSLFYLVICTDYFFFFSNVRQAISISLLILSFYCLRHKKVKLSVVWYILAGLFHTGSWIFIFVYIVNFLTLEKKYLYTLLVASTIASFIIDPYYLFSFVKSQGGNSSGTEMIDYYSSYSSYLVGNQLPVLRLILYTIPFVFLSFLILYHCKRFKKGENLYAKIFIVGTIVNNIVIGNPIGFRLMKASLLLAMLLIPATFTICKNKKSLYLFYSLFLLFIYFSYVYSRTIIHFENEIIPYQLNSALY